VDRAECARRGITVCNIPDYGTEEVADHAISLALGLRRGLFLHHETQRANPPAPWGVINTPLIRRLSVQRFAVLGLGRIGTAVALRAKAFGFDVVFFDPFLPNGVDRALGIRRAPSLAALMEQADVLSIHAPLTRKTRGLVGAAELALLPKGAVVESGTLIDYLTASLLSRFDVVLTFDVGNGVRVVKGGPMFESWPHWKQDQTLPRQPRPPHLTSATF
jgi:C-terminal binding protein